jgi:hypothetical protein
VKIFWAKLRPFFEVVSSSPNSYLMRTEDVSHYRICIE